ncbi:MAG TPA: heparinase II/III family protein [archaeon]|nr:heparinase II/III family protein [archaeon]
MKKTPLILSVLCLFLAGSCFGVEVFEGHPRLFSRDSAWGERSITTGLLKTRALDSRYSAYVNRLTYSECNYALAAVLLDNEIAAQECLKMLKEPFEFDGTTTDGELVMWRAMAFDWFYNHPAFTDQDKKTAADILAQGANWCVSQYEDQGPHIFHTRMYAFAAGAGIAGLALKDHHLAADSYINWAYSTFRDKLFPARRFQGGSVHNSLAYGRKYTMRLCGHFMSAWYSATGEDLWKTVRKEQDDWAWREAEFIIYARQPDGLLVRYGDCFRRTSERFSFRVIGERAFAYSEPIGMNYLNYLFETQATMPDNRVVEEGNAYNVLLWWDADDSGTSFTILPTRTIFSPKGTGMVFWRTGWGEDDTFIFFKCGNYFEDHGHFDQGHLEVFRGAPLLIESGAYEGAFDSDHRMYYYRKSIAHNTILAVDPSIPNDEGGQRIYSNQSESSLESYLADAGSETGDIVDYRDNGEWAFAAGDFSKAYYATRVSKAVREIAWLGERYLVVVDNVTLAGSSYLPKVIWHYTVRPVLENNRFTVTDRGGRAVVTVLAPSNATIDTVRAFQIGTAYYPPPELRPELGVGRVEVSVPETGAGDYTFIEVIDVADEGIAAGESTFEADATSGSLVINVPAGVLTLSGEPGARTRVDFESAGHGGDYNSDGILDIQDVIALLLLARDNRDDPAVDFNRDGGFSIADAVALLLYIRRQGAPSLAGAGNFSVSLANLSQVEKDYLLGELKKLELDASEWSTASSLLGSRRLPQAYGLDQNSPNPFNPSTVITYSVSQGQAVPVRLEVFSLQGRTVKTLVNEVREAGVYSVFWDGTDKDGARAASGVYLYRLTAGDYTRVRKMVLLR